MALDSTSNWLDDIPSSDLRRVVDALYRVQGLIAVITDLDLLLERIMAESKEVANAEACSLMLYDEEQQELYFHVALGETGDQQALKRHIRMKLGDGIAGRVANNREPINVEDAQSDDRVYKPALSPYQALKIMKEEMRDHFDQQMFKEFLYMLY